jgi:ADP-ribosylglycohydrolase
MKGVIIGDIIGSIYEFNNYKGEPNDFELFTLINAATLISHNHKESLKGAKAVSSAIWYLLNGATKEDVGIS